MKITARENAFDKLSTMAERFKVSEHPTLDEQVAWISEETAQIQKLLSEK